MFKMHQPVLFSRDIEYAATVSGVSAEAFFSIVDFELGSYRIGMAAKFQRTTTRFEPNRRRPARRGGAPADTRSTVWCW